MKNYTVNLLGLNGVDRQKDYTDFRMIELIGSRNALAHEMYRREKCTSRTADVMGDVVQIIEGSKHE